MKISGTFFWLFVTCAVFSSAIAVAGETLYVSDQLVITLRQGKSTKHKIIKTIKTGTSMELLEKKKDDPYVKVKLGTGEIGYVLDQYTTQETPKSAIISLLEKEVKGHEKKLSQLDVERQKLAADLKALKDEKAQKEEELGSAAAGLDQELKQAKDDLQELTAKYNDLLDKSQKVVQVTDERDSLLKTNTILTSEVDVLRNENSGMKQSGFIKWFLAGGGVFFFGWIIGKVFSGKKTQRLSI